MPVMVMVVRYGLLAGPYYPRLVQSLVEMGGEMVRRDIRTQVPALRSSKVQVTSKLAVLCLLV